MGFKGFFSSNFETSDNHSNPKLRTHYYRNTYEQAKAAIRNLVQEFKGYKVSINDKYQEISFETRGYFCVISVINPNPVESAIDIKLSFNMMSFGRGPKVISKMYLLLDSSLNYKGSSLYRG